MAGTESAEEDMRKALEKAEDEEAKYWIRNGLQKLVIDGPEHKQDAPDE